MIYVTVRVSNTFDPSRSVRHCFENLAELTKVRPSKVIETEEEEERKRRGEKKSLLKIKKWEFQRFEIL